MKTAILVDGAFFLMRAKAIWGNLDPSDMADHLINYCHAHLRRSKSDNRSCELYRIFYYDCPPSELQSVNPISGKHINLRMTPNAKWRLSFFEELKQRRKTALRLGTLDHSNPIWLLKSPKLNHLCNGRITIEDLQENDVNLDMRQKGVDMRLGLDIASLSFKQQVDQIILIAGDSDFVPAAKLARREGIDFILDSMWLSIKADLNEHIDGRRSMIKKPDKYGNFDGRIIWPKLDSKLTGERIKSKLKKN